MKQLKKILPVQSGYFLEDDEYDGFLSVIIPQKSDNLVLNPLMNDSNGDNKPDNWLIPDGGINPIVYSKHVGGPFWTHFYRFCWPGSGTISALVADTINGTYTASVWVRSADNSRFFIKVLYNNGVSVRKSSVEFTASDTWQQFSFTFNTDNTTGSGVQLEIVGNDIFCLDVSAVQLEKGEYATTFIHGFAGEGFQWLGTPFASASRRALSVSNGGRLVNLKDLGMKLTAIEGLGIPNINHSTTDLAFKYGSKFNGMNITDRDFDIEFTLYSMSLEDLLCSRNQLGRAIFRLNEAVTFVWRPLDCGVPICEPVVFKAVYKSGFSLGLNSHYGEEIKLSFTAYDIEIKQITQTTNIVTGVTTLVHPAIVGMDEFGNLKLLPPLTSISASIFACEGMVTSPYDNNLYVIVSETPGPGVARGMVLRYDGTSWTKIAQGTTTNGAMTAIHADSKYIYVAISNLQTIDGTSGFSGTSGTGITRINLATKTVDNIGSLAAGTTLARNGVSSVQPIIRSIVSDALGRIYIGGNFTGMTTATSARHLAVYDHFSSTWLPCNIDLTNHVGGVNSLYYDRSNRRLYVGGDIYRPSFVSDSGTCHVFFYLNLLGTTSLGGTPVRTDFPYTVASSPGTVYSLTKYKNRIILGGDFRSSYGADVDMMDNIGFYNPDVQGGFNVKGLIQGMGNPKGTWGIDGTFAAATGIPGTEPVANVSVCGEDLYISGKIQYFGYRYNNTTFNIQAEACGVVKYVSTAATAEVGQMFSDVAFGYVSALPYTQCFMKQVICGTAKLGLSKVYATYLLSSPNPTVTTYAPQPTIINLCATDLPVSPKFIVIGPATLIEISNQTHGYSLYFNYAVFINEILIVDLTTSPPTIKSSTNGDVGYSLLPASTPGAFKLLPGENSIIVKAKWNSVLNGTTTFAVQYTRQALAAEALCCDCPE